MSHGKQDSRAYLKKKAAFAKVLTIYGRKPVAEALEQTDISPFRLHLADSNKPAGIINDIIKQASHKGAEVLYHSRAALSRISKNSKQDQGVALDIQCQGFTSLDEFTNNLPSQYDLIAVDAVTNPQNLGMIIRSACASPCTAVLLPEHGCARLDALVIKASAGTLFKANIIRCDDLAAAITQLRERGAQAFALAGGGNLELCNLPLSGQNIYVVGNETHGISAAVMSRCQHKVRIAMARGVESLNVGVAASLVAFHRLYR
ncbi:MAG TPA: RNA methyltransferase [Marinagarivorans sp.]